jgi:hypothetical protein
MSKRTSSSRRAIYKSSDGYCQKTAHEGDRKGPHRPTPLPRPYYDDDWWSDCCEAL